MQKGISNIKRTYRPQMQIKLVGRFLLETDPRAMNLPLKKEGRETKEAQVHLELRQTTNNNNVTAETNSKMSNNSHRRDQLCQKTC